MNRLLALILPDRFIPVLLATVVLASVFPLGGEALVWLGYVSIVAIVALFFVHGARLSRQAVRRSFTQFRLHSVILACTFVGFPLIGLALTKAAAPLIGPVFTPGALFLCALPTTVASSIAMVSIARGNVAASVVAAAMSNMIGVVMTPLIFAALLSTSGAPLALGGIGKVILILALPFAIGQFLRPAVGSFIDTRPWLSRLLDRITILLAVYTALSAAVGSGLFDDIAPGRFALLLVAMLMLLVLVITGAILVGRLLGFDYGDRAALLFAAMQKSVISGTPMARVLFPGAEAGLIILPLLVYYIPMQTVSAIMAARMGIRREASEPFQFAEDGKLGDEQNA